MSRIQDWVLELGFDGSKVEEGLKKVDRLMVKSNQLESKRLKIQQARVDLLTRELSLSKKIGQVRQPVAMKSATIRSVTSQSPSKPKTEISSTKRSSKSSTDHTKREIALLNARNALMRRADKAESIGLKSAKEKNMLSSSNVSNIRKTIALLNRRIIVRERELALQKKQTEEVKKQQTLSQKTPNIPLGQRAPTAAQRDRTATTAQRGAVRAADLIQLAPTSDAAQQLRAIKKELLGIEKAASTAGTREELRKLHKQAGDLNFEMRRVAVSQKEAARAMTRTQFAAKGLRESINNLARSYVSIFAIIGTAAALLRTAKDFERIRSTMLLSSEGAEDAQRNFQFVQDTARKLGADISATADAFAGFNVSALSAGLTAARSKEIFTQLATSIQATGLDAHRSGLAFLAFKQMLAGPVIQAQEMNQVVEQMPQFTGIAIKALKEMGHEGENFRETIATGTVESQKFVSIVAKMMEEQARTTGAAEKSQNNLIAAQNRMNNALKNMADIVATSGLNNALMDIFTVIGDALRIITPALKTVAIGFRVITDAVTAPIQAFTKLTDILGITDKVIFGLAATFLWLNRATLLSSLGLTKWSAAAATGGKATGLLSKSLVVLRGAIVGVSGAFRALMRIGPLLLFSLGFELLDWLMGVVKGTDAWKSGVDAVSGAISSAIRFVSRLIARFRILIATMRLYSQAFTDSDFSLDDAKRVIQISSDAGRRAGLAELSRRRGVETTNNSTSNSTTNNNEFNFNINGGDTQQVRKELEAYAQQIFAGAN